MMYSISLMSDWQLKRLSNGTVFKTSLPASVYSTLLEHQVIPDPYWRNNEDMLRDLMYENFMFSINFEASPELLTHELQLLRCEGIDTVADLYLNDIWLGRADNMHRCWEFNVTQALKPGTNELKLVFESPFRLADEAYTVCPTQGTEDAWRGFSHIRKAHYMYGWDWGAHLPDMGVFRPIKLLGISQARINSVHIRQTHEQQQVRLDINPCLNFSDQWQQDRQIFDHPAGLADHALDYSITIREPDGREIIFKNSPDHICIEQPQLWWPNGLGDQPLYQITCILHADGQEVDRWQRQIGLRQMTVDTSADTWGERFAHQVNGVNFFAMGADYIPEDHMLPRTHPERTRRLLEDCKKANFNSIRVWGGGYYPDDYFYDLCDELGLVVWQDFMFACSAYELTPDFEHNITHEFIDNIKRIRHHASLGLWCGNNEMEDFVKQGHWVSKPSEVKDYLLMYERIIPSVLSQHDPDTFYWPSSPSSGGSFDDPQSPDRGDVHYWDVWHGNKPFTAYRKFRFRYLSEFGFQALPAVATVQQMITDQPEELNLFSYIMEKHQRNHAANGKIMNYLQQTYRYPGNFFSLVYASQLLQADAIRYGVEHFRRNRGHCMGAVYWQLNDCWPVISWASIDYAGRWKALHYYAKRFFAPILVSCAENGWLTEGMQPNRQDQSFEKSFQLNITNETRQETAVTISWALRAADGKILRSHSTNLVVEPMSAIWLEKIYFTDDEIDVFDQYVSYEATIDSHIVSSGSVLFVPPKYFRFLKPEISCQVQEDYLLVSADVFAKSIEIKNNSDDLLLDDNYFDLHGSSKRIKIIRGKPEGLMVRSVYDIGRND